MGPVNALCVRPTELDKARQDLFVCALPDWRAPEGLSPYRLQQKVLFLFVVDRRVFVIFIFSPNFL